MFLLRFAHFHCQMCLAQINLSQNQLVFNMNYHLLGERDPSNVCMIKIAEQIISDIPLKTAASVRKIDFQINGPEPLLPNLYNMECKTQRPLLH